MCWQCELMKQPVGQYQFPIGLPAPRFERTVTTLVDGRPGVVSYEVAPTPSGPWTPA